MADSTLIQTGVAPAKKEIDQTVDCYRGSAAEIVATGLVRHDQLPGEPGRHPTTTYYRCGEPVEGVRRIDYQSDAENWVRIRRVTDGDTFVLTVGIPRAEKLRRLAASKADSQAMYRRWDQERFERQSQRIQLEINSLPKSKSEYLAGISRMARGMLCASLASNSPLPGEARRHGFVLSERSIGAILTAFDESVAVEIGRAAVTFDQQLHQDVIEKHRHALAAMDPGFKKHLADLTRRNPSILDGEKL